MLWVLKNSPANERFPRTACALPAAMTVSGELQGGFGRSWESGPLGCGGGGPGPSVGPDARLGSGEKRIWRPGFLRGDGRDHLGGGGGREVEEAGGLHRVPTVPT